MKIKIAQEILQAAGLYTGPIDGEFGRNSRAAAMKYYNFPNEWPNKRVWVGVVQVFCIRNNVNVGVIDGRWGQKTQSGYEKILPILGKKDIVIEVESDVKNLGFHRSWPRATQSSLTSFYGNRGANQTSLILPYKMVLAWDETKTVSKITCHKKVSEAFEEIFALVKEHYGMDAIRELGLDQFGGVLNVRKMRGGSSWSHHSWGCVMDIDPDRNRLRWKRDRAFLAKPEYKPFWDIVYSTGMTGLGPERGYDWMHFGGVKY